MFLQKFCHPLMRAEPLSENLLLTERGEQWLAKFDDADKPTARALVSGLTLISELEFERKLLTLIEHHANKSKGIVALFGVRELADGERIFSQIGDNVNSTPTGTDIGSEGRIATIIRNLARERPEKILNHPTWDEMRKNKCHRIFFIDDFIGSGKRVKKYIDDFYNNPTIKSWQSYGLIRTKVLAYSGTTSGISRISSSRMHPSVRVERSCPTIQMRTWNESITPRKIESLCKKYAKRAMLGYPLGFGKSGALMVFEHSCPNNCPQILWGTNDEWSPLFYGKSISSQARNTFPPEIVRQDPVSVLIAAGEKRIAESAKNLIGRPLPAEWLAVLSLFSRGVRRVDAVENVTGMNNRDSAEVIEKCVTAGLLSQKWRLTDFGDQELRSSRKTIFTDKKVLPKTQQDDYYPTSLRSRKKC